MLLEGEGFPTSETREHNGQRVLITGRQRQTREDPVIDGLHIRLRKIPANTGPERDVIAVASLVIALSSVIQGIRRFRKNAPKDTHEVFDKTILAQKLLDIEGEIRLLIQDHRSGEVGPETYERQRRQLSIELARVKQALQSAQTQV